ncbi:J domain-containing protein [Cysteiniphilum sp. 6C5]|uniref:J domain-containing protein n=1 Tax=unclassified Cysteiniphilum TaxID=2610889 RepID=UPI003F847CD4
MNPYLILNVTPEDTDEQIKSSYQTLIKQYSPEKFPEIYQKLQEAYEKIKDVNVRVYYEYFSVDMVDKHDLCTQLISNNVFDITNREQHLLEYFNIGQSYGD